MSIVQLVFSQGTPIISKFSDDIDKKLHEFLRSGYKAV
jgi:hypothetical protein